MNPHVMNRRTVLAELIKISNAVGKDRSLVLGESGNTSVKTADGKYVYIKASGTALKDMNEQTGWRRLKVDSVLAILKDKSVAKMGIDEREAKVANALLSACDDEVKADIKPSIETCFHSMLDRYVIHLHPAAVLAYACAKNGQAELEKLFKNEKFPPLWVPYADLGYMLAKRIEKLVADYKTHYGRAAAVMFLQNHGLLVAANSSNTALRLVRKVVSICRSKLKQPKAVKIKRASAESIAEAALVIREAFLRLTGKCMTVRHFIDDNVAGFMAREDAARLCSLPAVTPDELVYSHGSAMWLDKWEQQTVLDKLNRLYCNGRELPASFLIKPLGLFVVGNEGQSLLVVKDVVSTYLSVRGFAAGLGGIKPLNKRQREFIARRESGSCSAERTNSG